jgi:hypothetical protein
MSNGWTRSRIDLHWKFYENTPASLLRLWTKPPNILHLYQSSPWNVSRRSDSSAEMTGGSVHLLTRRSRISCSCRVALTTPVRFYSDECSRRQNISTPDARRLWFIRSQFCCSTRWIKNQNSLCHAPIWKEDPWRSGEFKDPGGRRDEKKFLQMSCEHVTNARIRSTAATRFGPDLAPCPRIRVTAPACAIPWPLCSFRNRHRRRPAYKRQEGNES